MINGNLTQFLDTGWYMESTLYYDGYVYWCEGYTDFDTRVSTFFVDRWRAECRDHKLYHELHTGDGNLIGYARVFQESGTDLALLKKHFLQAPLFNGKSFWDVEKKLAWVEEGKPIVLHHPS